MKKIKISDISIKKIKNNGLVKELPELYQLKKIVENNKWHNKERVFDHTLTVLEELNKIIKKSSSKIKARLNQKVDKYTGKHLLFLAALLHDVGKKETLIRKGNLAICPNHETASVMKARSILKRFDLTRKEKKMIIEIIKNHGLISSILNPGNKKINAEYKKFKSRHSSVSLELVLLNTADMSHSHLKNTKPNEFKLRMDFLNEIIHNY